MSMPFDGCTQIEPSTQCGTKRRKHDTEMKAYGTVLHPSVWYCTASLANTIVSRVLSIDYTLIDKALYDQGAVKAAAIVLTPMKMSDHVAVTCTLAVNCKGAARPCANAACNLPPFKATNKSLVSMFGKSHKKARKKRPRPATATATSTAAAVVATTKPITTPPPPSPVDETGSGGGAGGGAGVGLAAAAAAGAKRQRVPTVKRSLSATPPPSHTSKPPRGQASLHAFLSASSTN